jgi:hypothetical protein
MSTNTNNPYLLTPSELKKLQQNNLSYTNLMKIKQNAITRLRHMDKPLPINIHNPIADTTTLLSNQLLGKKQQPGEPQPGEPEPQPGEQKGGRRRTTRHKHRKHKRTHTSKRKYRK